MPECTVCGEDDFSEEAGYFYCTTCNTQSQELRVVVVDTDEFVSWTGHKNKIREKKTKEPKEKKEKIVDYGRPWSIYEAYQIIIQHQVQALIKLGAHPDLKDIVFKMWVNYLSKLGVAFTSDPVNEKLQKCNRQRELFPGTTKNPMIKNILGRSRRKQTVGISQKQAELQLEKDRMTEALEGEEFYEGDNPLEHKVEEDPKKQNEDEESEDEIWDEDKIKLWGKQRKNVNCRSVLKMQMAYTLALCYLGLMYTNPLTTVCDVIRWVETNKVPYKKVLDLFPDDMKFCFNDRTLFGMGMCPTAERLRLAAGTLTQFLHLDNFPEFPMAQLISKYIIQLDLPAELHAYATNLYMSSATIKMYKPTKIFNRIVFWEGMAIAYVVLVLKLIFGLDDNSERLFSVYSREIMKLLDSNQRLFVWEDWLSHVTSKVQTSETSFVPAESDSGDSSDSDLIAKKVGREQEERKTVKDAAFKLYQTKMRDAIQKPLLELSDRWKTRQKVTDNSGHQATDEAMTFESELNLTSDTLNDEDPLGYLLGLHDSQSRDKDSCSATTPYRGSTEADTENRAKGDYFRKCSVQHLINPDTFLDDLEKECMNDTTIYSSCAGSTIADDEENGHVSLNIQDENSMDLFQEISSPRKKQKKNEDQSRVKSSLRTFVVANVHPAPTVSKIVNKERYQFVIEQLKHVKEQFILSLDYDSTKALACYNWLLYVCGRMIDCSSAEIQEEVRKLEVKLFADNNDLSRNGRYYLNRLNRTTKNYMAMRWTHF